MKKRILAFTLALSTLLTTIPVHASCLNPVSETLTFREIERAEWIEVKVDSIRPSYRDGENVVYCTYRNYWVVSYYADTKATVQVGDNIELLIIDKDKFLDQRVIDAR